MVFVPEPPVEELLSVDHEYRVGTEHGTLLRIAPRRFNPDHTAWLPLLHTQRGNRRYTALFSNTARAHQLLRTHDWVVLYVDGHEQRQYTVVTEWRGVLKGKRVVRGREVECAHFYRPDIRPTEGELMSSKSRVAAAVLAVLCTATPLAAQMSNRPLMVGLYAGGYHHLLDLNTAGTTSFTAGYSVGGTAGVQLNRYVSVHGDVTFHWCDAQGSASFSGHAFDMAFYGAHVEVGYPLRGGITPYVFLGGGAMRVHESGPFVSISPFTKPAAMFGAGLFYALPWPNVELFAEANDHVYNWDRGVADQQVWSVMSTGGRSYVVPFDGRKLDHTQWDFTYTAGVSYRFAW